MLTIDMRLAGLFRRFYQDPLYRNSIMVMINQGTNLFTGFFFWIVAARVIPSSDVGLGTAVLSLVMLIMTCSGLGMSNGLIRYLPQHDDKKTLYSSVLIVNLILAFALTVIVLLLIGLLFPALVFLSGGVFPVLFILLVLTWTTMSVQNYTLIALRKADLSVVQFLLCIIKVPLVFLLAIIGIASVFYSLILAFSLAIIFGIVVLYMMGLPFTFRLDLATIGKIFKFSLGNFTADLFINAPMMIVPFIIVNTIGPQNNAYFYIAYSVAGLLFIIPYGISTSLFVECSHDLPIREMTIKALKLLLFILVPVLVVIYFFGNYFLLVFNAEYADKAFDLLRLLAISSIFVSIISIYVSILRVSKNIKMMNIIYLLYSASLIAFGYLAIIHYGLIGIGYSWIVSSLFICLLISYNISEKSIRSALSKIGLMVTARRL